MDYPWTNDDDLSSLFMKRNEEQAVGKTVYVPKSRGGTNPNLNIWIYLFLFIAALFFSDWISKEYP